MSDLTISHHDEEGWRVLRLEGCVDAHTFTDFEQELTRLVEGGHYKLRRLNSRCTQQPNKF